MATKCIDKGEVETQLHSPTLLAFPTVTSSAPQDSVPDSRHDMAESPTHSSPTSSLSSITPQIPIEIIPDEEMAFVEAAMAAATRSITSSIQFPRNIRSVDSITLLSKRRLSSCSQRESESVSDIEDLGGTAASSKKKKNTITESFLNRFRRKRALGVTDLTGTVFH